MKIPSVFWFVLIPALVAGLVPVLTAFFPPATVWWSAAAIAVMGAIVAAVQAWRDSQSDAAAGGRASGRVDNNGSAEIFHATLANRLT